MKQSIDEIERHLRRLKLPQHVIERHIAQLKKARVVERKREYSFTSASTGGAPGTRVVMLTDKQRRKTVQLKQRISLMGRWDSWGETKGAI